MVGLTEQDRRFIQHQIGAAVYAIGTQIASNNNVLPMDPEATLREFFRLTSISQAEWEHSVVDVVSPKPDPNHGYKAVERNKLPRTP